jgi:hypothetical protein
VRLREIEDKIADDLPLAQSAAEGNDTARRQKLAGAGSA